MQARGASAAAHAGLRGRQLHPCGKAKGSGRPLIYAHLNSALLPSFRCARQKVRPDPVFGPFDERSLPGPASGPPAVTTSQSIATSTTAATPSTSLIQNGDFSKTNISTWIDGKKLKGYNGSGFEWAAGSVEGWSAYAGSTIEVWNTGTRVVELNGDKSNYGIQQKVEAVKPGAYLLSWRSLGRTQEAAPAKNKKTPPAPNNLYFVQVQVGEGSGGRAIKTENFTAGGDGVLVFQLSENDLTAANGKGIYIAFIPTNGSNSYGSLISGVNLLPVEVKVVNRDDPKKTWADAQASAAGTVYAGKESGDMVSWKLNGLDSATFTWKATGPTGNVISGPTGSGKNEWKIADGDSDTTNDWLKWKPGKYTIKCTVQPTGGSSFDIDLDQEVGWRTESWMVIGQIVQTHTHDGDAPAVIEYNGGLDISSPVAMYRRAITYDIAGWFPLGTAGDAARDAVTLTPLPITAKLAEAWFGYWAMVMPHTLTPKGPFNHASPSGNGIVTEPHRLWMTQHLFNISYDRPSVDQTISEESLKNILKDQQYRILHRYQVKFEVASGAIKSGSLTALSPLGDQGKTKINIGVEAGEFNPVWDNPACVYNLTSDEPELSPKSNKDGKVSSAAHAISSYWSARVGAHGRNANWRLLGLDAPWIFSEIIFEMKSDGTVDTRLRASVDVAWKDGRVTSGTKQFNNLNIYKRAVAIDGVVQYERKGLLEMDGKLRPFVNSATGAWPEPPLEPEIR